MMPLSSNNLTMLTASVTLLSFIGAASAIPSGQRILPVVSKTDILKVNNTPYQVVGEHDFGQSALKKRAKFEPDFNPGKVLLPKFSEPGTTNFCTDEQKQMIIRHLSYALRVLEHVVDNKETSPSSRGYLTYIDANGPNNQDRFDNVMQVFGKMKESLVGVATGDDARVPGRRGHLLAKCGSSSACKSGALAHADAVGHGIQFCDSFFKKRSIVNKVTNFLTQSSVPSFDKFKCRTNSNGKTVFDFKGASIRPDKITPLYEMPVHTLIHELAHLHGYSEEKLKIDDCYYGAYAAEYLAKAVPTGAARNADNYAWFGMAHYIHSFCGDDETEQPVLRDADDDHSPSSKESWEEFNESKVKYFALAQKLASVEAEFKAQTRRKNDMQFEWVDKEGGPTDEDKKALKDLEENVKDLEKQKNDIAREITLLGPTGRMNEDTVKFCETGRTRWADIVSVMGSD